MDSERRVTSSEQEIGKEDSFGNGTENTLKWKSVASSEGG